MERFINGVQIAGLFLAGLSASLLFSKIKIAPLLLFLIIISTGIMMRPNFDYLNLNKEWLLQSNVGYEAVFPNYQKLVDKIKSLPPGRTYAGQPGNWGRDFKIGATQMYLALSTSGLNINGFLPESWSLNSDPEALFNEERIHDYNLFNVRYLVTPKEKELPSFAQKINEYGPFILSEVKTTGYFELGTSNLLVKTDKENIMNIIHLWMGSEISFNQEFPALQINDNLPSLPYANILKIEGTNTFVQNGKTDSLFNFKYPAYIKPKDFGEITEEKIADEKYEAKYKVTDQCVNCLVVFKMTYHPNWQVFVDDKKVNKFMVFPSYMAVQANPGEHTIRYEYVPSGLKIPLILLGLLSPLLYFLTKNRFTK